MQNGTKRQAGGILAFILIGLVLVALLGGGIYFSKQQGRVASRADTVATDTTSADDKTSDTAQNGTTKGNDVEGTTTPPAQSSPNTSQPQAATPAPVTPAPTSATGTQAVPATGPSHIAATGPSDVIVPMVALSLLVGGVISYYRSAIAFRTQALKRSL